MHNLFNKRHQKSTGTVHWTRPLLCHHSIMFMFWLKEQAWQSKYCYIFACFERNQPWSRRENDKTKQRGRGENGVINRIIKARALTAVNSWENSN